MSLPTAPSLKGTKSIMGSVLFNCYCRRNKGEEICLGSFVEFGYKFDKQNMLMCVSRSLNRQFITRTNIKCQTKDEKHFYYAKTKQMLQMYTLSF